VVVVTHDPNVAAFCSRTVTMRDGRLLGGEQ
jgi:putative ABC transport system ATP-binding protein